MSRLKIMLVDDNKIVVLGVLRIYKNHIPDATVITAENGKEALEILSKTESDQNLPCLIILDINMPILNGIEFLEIIKKNTRFCNIPVMIHTTSSNIKDYKTCKSLGISGYYVKHVDYSIYKNNLITIVDYWNNSFRNNL
tara:strand:- start:6674 stop:7093 length:420 start_codon:yes stop_codon:yes gene_type:complete